MNNIWKTLKISPTTDARVIKKAYAKEVKNCHQEDEPERFMELHEAYKQALEYVSPEQADGQIRMPKQPDSEASKEEQPELVAAEQEANGEKAQDTYTELFEEIVIAEREKKKYEGVFPEFPADKEFKHEEIIKQFLEAEDIQRYFGDVYFWLAFDEYLADIKLEYVACAYLIEKRMTLESVGQLVLEDSMKEAFQKQHKSYWAHCTEMNYFLPKKLPEYPYEVAKKRNVIWLLFCLLVFGALALLFYAVCAKLAIFAIDQLEALWAWLKNLF